jgi:hypothetical protein
VSASLQVLIDIKAELAGLTNAIAQMNALKAATRATADAGRDGFANIFKIGESIDLTRRFNDLIAEIPAKLKEWLTEGVEFNAELQKTQAAIAGLFKQEAPAQFATFEQAKAAAGETIELLKAKANELGIAYSDMFETFEHAQAQLAAGGVKNIKDQIDLIALLNRAMQSLGVSSQNASRDIGDILQGQASRTLGGGRLAAAMGISKEELDQTIIELQQSGTLAQGLREKLGGIAASMAGASQTFDADVNRMRNALFDLKTAASGPIMQPLTEAIETFTSILKDDDIRAWGRTAGDVLRDVADFVALCVVGWKAMGAAVRGVGADISGLLGPLKSVATFLESNPFLKSIFTGVKTGISAAVNAGLDALGPIGAAARLGSTIGNYLSDTVAKEKQNVAAIDAGGKGLELQVKARAQSKAALEEIKKIEDDIALKHAESSGDTEAIAQKHAQKAYDETLRTVEAQLVAHHFVGDAHKEAVRLAEKERDATLEVYRAKGAQKGAHQEINQFLREEESLMQRIRQQQQLVDANKFLTVDQKNALNLQLMTQETTLLNDEIAKGQRLIAGGSLDPATYEQVAQKVQQARFEVDLLALKMQTLSFGGGLKASLFDWIHSFGSAAQQIGKAITGSIGTAIDGISGSLTDIIFQTGNWRQNVLNAEKQIVSSLIKIGLQMIVSATLGKVLTKENVVQQGVAGAQIAVAHAPAAAATSISSFGSAAVLGAAAAAAAIALIIGLLAGGFEKGGYTGSGGRTAIAGVVHGQEFVHSKPTVDYYGLPFMAAIHRRAIPVNVTRELTASLANYRYQSIAPRLGGFELGGAVAAISASADDRDASRDSSRSASATPIVNNHALFYDRSEAVKWLRTQDGENFFVDLVKGTSHRLPKT